MISLTLLGNVVGIVITASLVLVAKGNSIQTLALEQIALKFEGVMWHQTFILALFCGVLMYTAVDGFKRIKDPIIRVLVVILSVVIFLLSGFEHSIANIAYVVLAKTISFKIVLYLIAMILGNGLGAIILNLIHKKCYDIPVIENEKQVLLESEIERDEDIY